MKTEKEREAWAAYQRDWRRRNREKVRKMKAAWREKNPERHAAHNAKWKAENPEKVRAHSAVQHAVSMGRLERESCEKCGADAQAHHDDYGKPLDVRWLCSVHHAEEHGWRV